MSHPSFSGRFRRAVITVVASAAVLTAAACSSQGGAQNENPVGSGAPPTAASQSAATPAPDGDPNSTGGDTSATGEMCGMLTESEVVAAGVAYTPVTYPPGRGSTSEICQWGPYGGRTLEVAKQCGEGGGRPTDYMRETSVPFDGGPADSLIQRASDNVLMAWTFKDGCTLVLATHYVSEDKLADLVNAAHDRL